MRWFLLCAALCLACDDGSTTERDPDMAVITDGAQPALDMALPDPDCCAADMAPDGPTPADAALPDVEQRDADLSDGAAVDAAPRADAGDDNCAAVWGRAEHRVVAPARPNDPALRLVFNYGREAGRAWIELERIDGEQVIRPSNGPFSVDEHSGAWAELRDDADRTLYTRGVSELIPESAEVPPDKKGEFMRFSGCPDQGFIRLQNFPNDPAAKHIVLFQSALDGEPGGPTVEIARFQLP